MRRVEPPAVRRAQIVEAAKRRFREDGFHAATMAGIAALAGVSVGLLYRYFPSKEEIIQGIVEADLQAQLEAIEGPLAAHPDDDSAALDALIARLTRLALDRDRTLLMLEIVAETARNHNPALAGYALETEHRVITQLADRFGAGLPQEERETRVRMMLNFITALGLEVYRDPSRQAVAVRLTNRMIRLALDPGTGPS